MANKTHSLAAIDFWCPSHDQSTETMRVDSLHQCCCRVRCTVFECESAHQACLSEPQCTHIRRSRGWATLKTAPVWWYEAPGSYRCIKYEREFANTKPRKRPSLHEAWRLHHCDDFTRGNQLTKNRTHKLIFDIGFHSGEDSLYFLKEGYDVVAVDANPLMIQNGLSRPIIQLANRHGWFHAIASGITRRIEHAKHTMTFYIHRKTTEWSTFIPPLQARNNFKPITVPVVTCGDLIRQFGVPYYMKV